MNIVENPESLHRAGTFYDKARMNADQTARMSSKMAYFTAQ